LFNSIIKNKTKRLNGYYKMKLGKTYTMQGEDTPEKRGNK